MAIVFFLSTPIINEGVLPLNPKRGDCKKFNSGAILGVGPLAHFVSWGHCEHLTLGSLQIESVEGITIIDPISGNACQIQFADDVLAVSNRFKAADLVRQDGGDSLNKIKADMDRAYEQLARFKSVHCGHENRVHELLSLMMKQRATIAAQAAILKRVKSRDDAKRQHLLALKDEIAYYKDIVKGLVEHVHLNASRR